MHSTECRALVKLTNTPHGAGLIEHMRASRGERCGPARHRLAMEAAVQSFVRVADLVAPDMCSQALAAPGRSDAQNTACTACPTHIRSLFCVPLSVHEPIRLENAAPAGAHASVGSHSAYAACPGAGSSYSDPFAPVKLDAECALMARKFTPGSAASLLKLYRNCTAGLGVLACPAG